MGPRLPTMTSKTLAEAKVDAVHWLDEYHRISAYEWEQRTPTTLACEPRPRFPCYVMAMATPHGDNGYRPCLAFTAGVKHDGRYWQGLIPEGANHQGLSFQALTNLDAVLGVFITASQAAFSWRR